MEIERAHVPWLFIGKVRLLNLPSADAVVEELFTDNCYRIEEIPDHSVVFDVGAFYGEFGIYCHRQKHCTVFSYEPSRENYEIALINAQSNACGHQGYRLQCKAVSDHEGAQGFGYDPNHPAGSSFDKGTRPVPCVKLSEEVKKAQILYPGRPICVKLDCEGAERLIFKNDPDWIDQVNWISLEWHNHDGDEYAEILTRHDFLVDLEGSGPKPRAKWDKSLTGGLLHARR